MAQRPVAAKAPRGQSGGRPWRLGKTNCRSLAAGEPRTYRLRRSLGDRDQPATRCNSISSTARSPSPPGLPPTEGWFNLIKQRDRSRLIPLTSIRSRSLALIGGRRWLSEAEMLPRGGRRDPAARRARDQASPDQEGLGDHLDGLGEAAETVEAVAEPFLVR